MKLLLLLVCCSALWVEAAASSSIVKALPPSCDSLLALSSSISSSSEGNRDIYRRSLSPWTWRSSTDSNRIPSTLWEAECSSSFCLSPNKQTDRHNLNSVPVLQNVLVLTRSSKGLCYTASYRSVAVGCTCVWARIHHT